MTLLVFYCILFLLIYVSIPSLTVGIPLSDAEAQSQGHIDSISSIKPSSRKLVKSGLLVIPGLGRADRLTTVVENLALLENNYLKFGWDCIIYIYAPHNATDFWEKKRELSYISSLCNIVENTNKRVTENLYMVQPALLRDTYERIFILLDDCKLIPSDSTESLASPYFDLAKLVRIMERNYLTVASPRVIGANVGGGQQFRRIMQAEAQAGTEGYMCHFVEIFAWVLTVPAYEALWELLYPSVNPYGWGYDYWYDNYAKLRVRGHRMGIVSTVSVKHEQAEFGRTETATEKEKWKGVLAQEKVYYSHFGVNLKRCREKALPNATLYGGVYGYLYDSPDVKTAHFIPPTKAGGLVGESVLEDGRSGGDGKGIGGKGIKRRRRKKGDSF